MTSKEQSNEIVDKWAVIVGNSHPSGDPSLHLHRIYDYKDKQYAIDNMDHIKGMYKIAFVVPIKCDKDLD